MKGTRRRVNLGYLIDNIWNELGKNKPWDIHPHESPTPHAGLLELGEYVISHCQKMGAKLNPRMDDIDHDIWLRVVGAWVCYLEKEKEPRCNVANKINIDASNLTNFINGKRAITANALTILASLFGIQPFDLRPDLGADYVASLKKENQQKLKRIGNVITDAQSELDSIQMTQEISVNKIESNISASDVLDISGLRSSINEMRESVNRSQSLSEKLKQIKQEEGL